MPVMPCRKDNKPGFKWGHHGFCYTYNPNDSKSKKKARDKALRQGRAIHANKLLRDSYDLLQEIKLDFNKIAKSKLIPKYYSTAKPYYRMELPTIHDELKSIGWDKKKLIIDVKADGLRITIGKINGKGFAYVDPEMLKKKSPNVTNRLPEIIKELDSIPDNTILDGELIAVDGDEILHRTSTNALLNAKTVSPEKLAAYATVFIFDVLFFKGQDIRNQPLHERVEYLQQIKSTKHIWIERFSLTPDKEADAYIINGSNKKSIDKALDRILNNKIGRPKFIAEGVMIKDVNHEYEQGINHGWAKSKRYYEIDGIVLSKHLVKGSKNTYNYWIGVNISKDYYNKLISMKTKDWYHSVGILSKNKFYRGKDSINKQGKYIMVLGKTDNTNIKVNNGKVLRIAAEEVIKYNNPTYPDFPRYSFYIGRALEPIPEKSVSDTLDVLDKLSQFQPKRIPIEELKRINKAYDIRSYVEEGKIPKDVYEQVAKENEPLPKEFYIDQRKGKAFCQLHFRGIEPDTYKKIKSGKIPLWKGLIGQSYHIDIRIDFKEKKLVQYVMTDNDIQSLVRTMKGGHTKTKGGIMNVSHSMIVSKPSGEPPEGPDRFYKSKEKVPEFPAIDEEGAKLAEKIIIKSGSYWILPNQIGSTKYTYSYMALIWLGDVISGTERHDLHELFFYKKKAKDDLFNGKFTIKCLKDKTGRKRWEIWKSIRNAKPLDPILHSDLGYHWLVPASKVDKLGKESYKDLSKKLYLKKDR